MPNQGVVRFGAELQKRRKERRIKGVDFAESIGISQGELSRWERGVSRGEERLAELTAEAASLTAEAAKGETR